MPITTTVKLDLARNAGFSTDISQYLISARVTQGRKKSLDPMEPATAIVKLNNRDGRFSVDNAAGPYYGNWDDDYRGIRIKAGTRTFAGYITRIDQDPFIDNREVTLTCVDRLGLLAGQRISCGLFRRQPLHLILNRILDRLEKGEEITNPGGEGGSTDGYSAAAAGTTISATDALSFEGDYSIQAVCDGSMPYQGIQYDLGADVTVARKLAVFARLSPGDGSAACYLMGIPAGGGGWGMAVTLYDDRWTYISTAGRTGHRYILVVTAGYTAVTVLSDCLHQVLDDSIIARFIPTTLDAQVEMFGLYNAPSLENINKLMATEAAGFLYMGGFASLYGTVYASAQVVRDGKTTPSATFGDDGVNVPYVGLTYGLDAEERVSRVELRSDGEYEDTNEEATIWELAPTGQTVPAGETTVFHACYSQPARNCVLTVNSPDATPRPFAIAASGDDGQMYKVGNSYPPSSGPYPDVTGALRVGQRRLGSSPYTYYKYRSYVRFNTTSIPDAANIVAAKLRLYIQVNKVGSVWTIQVRDKAWGDTLEAGDWDGTGTIRGSRLTSYLPAPPNYIEIDIDPAAIVVDGYTEFEITSSRDINGNQPTGDEWILFYALDAALGYEPVLIVTYDFGPESEVFESYGVAGKVSIEAPADAPVLIDTMYITGIPIQATSEESLVVAEAETPPYIPQTLPAEMPYQATRSADMVAEAERLASRWSGQVRRFQMTLQEQGATSLAQMQQRELDDLIRLINTRFAFSTKVDANCFIEGMTWEVKDQGKVLELALDLEEK
jgi:hypothetical protein